MKRSCLHCTFAENTSVSETFPELICRRFPPVVGVGTQGFGTWLGVHHRDWCGEFRPQEKPSRKVTMKARV